MGFTKGRCVSERSHAKGGEEYTVNSYYETLAVTYSQDNGELVASAFNAATAVEEMGYDGIEAIKALPDLIEAIAGYTASAFEVGNTRMNPCDPDGDLLDAMRLALSKAKGENNAPV